jgi:hypothetical protein
MQQFIRKILLFLLIPVILIFIGLLLPAYPFEPQTYLFAKRDKDSLLNSVSTPRIIFIGGSSMALGLHSQMVKDSLGLNPINTGMDYNVGLSYMMSNVLQYVKKGDIVVIGSEYEQFYGRLYYGAYPVPWIEFKVTPGHLDKLNVNQWINLLRVIPGYAIPRLKIWKYIFKSKSDINKSYNRSSFNQFGDHFTHWKLQPMHPTPSIGYEGSFNSAVIDGIKEFEMALKKREAKLFISFPPFQANSFKLGEKQIDMVYSHLKENKFSVLGSPKDFIFPDSLIFDSPYHLTGKGGELRTLKLIEYLKKAGVSNYN